MNKVILLGRLVKDVEVRYPTSDDQKAIGRYTLAVNKKYKRENEPSADFINCITFGTAATFAEKYFAKGQQISVVGRLQVRSWNDKNGQKRWSTEVIVEEQFFAEGKKKEGTGESGFYPIDETIEDDDLPW